MKNLMTAFAALLVGTAMLFAQQPQQPPQGGRPEAPKPLTPEEKTAQMAQDYDLTAEQEAAVLELNKQYDGKLEFRFEGFGQGNGERKDPRNMSDAERQQFFEQMQERMAQMQEKQAQMETELTQLTNENVSLESELATKTGLSKVEEYAENNLGLQKLDKSQIEYVEVKKDTVAEVVESEDENIFVKIKNWFVLMVMNELQLNYSFLG